MLKKVMCPSCKKNLELTEDEISLDESEFFKQCPRCNKEFRVDIDWKKTYTSVML